MVQESLKFKNMLRKIFFFINGLFTIALLVNSQNVINVPSDYTTIQVALNNAIEGDIVLVQTGIYYENILWPGVNGIKLISAGDSSNTIIDGSELGSVIAFPNGSSIDTTTVIKGFKITNGGNVNFGGGIAMSANTGLTISSCWITKNYSNSEGGGIYTDGLYSEEVELSIINSNISYNTSWNGGGVLIKRSFVFFQSDIIAFNTSLQSGGGIKIEQNVDVRINSSLICNNHSGISGAGIYGSGGGRVFINRSNIINNTADFKGGGIYSSFTILNISDVNIINNRSYQGGGCFCSNGDTTIIVKTNIVQNKTVIGADGITGKEISAFKYFKVFNSNLVYNGFALSNLNNTSNYWNVMDNWWGHSSGPYHPTQNPGGLGDSTNIFVDINPWLIEPDPSAPPLPIQNVTVESLWPDSLKLIWDTSPISDLKGYRIYFDLDSNSYVYDSYTNMEDVGLDTSYVVQNLQPGKEYYFTVTCYDLSGNESWYSKEIKVIPNPSPLIITNPDKLNFDIIFIGESQELTLQVINQGTDICIIDSILINNNQFTTEFSNVSLNPNDSSEISILFSPELFGEIDGELTIYSNAFNSPEMTIPLTGFGDYPEKPTILKILDVPDDQGGQVRITFSRSKYDGLDNSKQIESYSIWRFQEDETWDAIGLFNAIQDSIYNYVAPTLCDSTVNGICYTTFKVSAHTTNPDIYYYSDTLSGYSVDNIAPAAPQGLKSALVDGDVQLTWESNKEADFQYYQIYKSDQPITDLSYTGINSFTTIDTTYLDMQVEVDNQYYYRIVAYDYAGNQSDLSNEVNLEITGIEDLQEIQKFRLEQNHPNPFVNNTTIKYALPSHAFVNISVYTLSGTKIATLVNEDKISGLYSFKWRPVNVKPGTYLYILKADDNIITKKLIILK